MRHDVPPRTVNLRHGIGVAAAVSGAVLVVGGVWAARLPQCSPCDEHGSPIAELTVLVLLGVILLATGIMLWISK